MSVTLTPCDPGGYSVGRGAEQYAGRASLLATFCDWELTWAPDGAATEQIKRFPTFRAGRAWLESADGQRWLDSLPRQA